MNYTSLVINLGIQGAIHNKEYRARCPFHDDSSPSFSMNTESGLAICHKGCFRGNFPQLVEAVLGCTFHEAADWIANNGQSNTVEDLVSRMAQVLGPKVASHYESVLPIDAPWFHVYQAATNTEMPDWFLDRGFSWQTVIHWGVRYIKGIDAIVLPVQFNGKFLGTVTRPHYGTPKYLNSEFKKSEILFGEINTNRREIIIVEGLLDALWLWQLGYNAVSPFGAFISQEQVDLLRKFRFGEIVSGLDNDEAGRDGTADLTAKLQKAGYLLPQITFIKYPGEKKEDPDYKKDANDCSPELFRQLFDNRKGFLG